MLFGSLSPNFQLPTKNSKNIRKELFFLNTYLEKFTAIPEKTYTLCFLGLLIIFNTQWWLKSIY